MTNDPLVEAANSFFVEPYKISIIGNSSGYSDSRLARVMDRRGQVWCLRQWIDTTEEAIGFIHHVLTHSRAQGFAGVPMLARTQTGESLVMLDDAWFEAQEWVAGAPIYRLEDRIPHQRTPNTAWNLTVADRRSVTTALAAFHSSTETLQPRLRQQPLQEQIAPGLQQAKIQQRLASEALNVSKSPEGKALMARWLHLLPVITAYLHERITDYPPALEHVEVVCHGDLWPDHVYFMNGIFCGFVDFGALTFTSPAFDLAQLILHFGGWQTREEVLTIYTSCRSLSPQDEAILPIVAASDLVSEGCWSLGQLCNDELSKQEAAAHWHNLHVLLPSLKALVEDLC